MKRGWQKALATAALGALTWGIGASQAEAFCGFYVSGADTKLFNNATQVVMMREGTRTVLAMQNNYQGPPADFAMVVPVPVVLQKENVKTLNREVFDHVDQLAAPRLVEYWEQDPCYEPPTDNADEEDRVPSAPRMMEKETKSEGSYGVKVEARFEVGEYDVVILSATYSSGLDQWLRDNKYKIPDGSEALLRPYVQSGSKFFVAKVDTKKVKFEKRGDKEMATLSPLRFHYDSDSFSLPIRLGLVNSSGTQDLIVHILATQRYDVANYKNVTIPTNLDVAEDARQQFGSFYAALFDETLEKNPGAVVTEYAWQATSCDPCPGPALDPQEISVLGADVLPGGAPGEVNWNVVQRMVVTRLHARYTKDAVGEDLVFKSASAIVGGRESLAENGKLETGSRPDSYNNFQGRYAIRHPWKGPISCASPRRGVWGGPPDGGGNGLKVATDLAFAPRGTLQLASFVTHDVPEISLKAASPLVSHAGEVPLSGPGGSGAVPKSGSCGACRVGGPEDTSAWTALAAAFAGVGTWLLRRRHAKK